MASGTGAGGCALASDAHNAMAAMPANHNAHGFAMMEFPYI
jgi:hypothetical protein